MTPQQVDSASFRSGMRRLAGGVNIITVQGPEGPLGITATAVMSVSADPPTALCCVNRESRLERVIREQGRYCINVLRAEHADLANRFAGMGGISGPERFTEGSWTGRRGVDSAPSLADSLVTFECDLLEVVSAHTHSLFIGLVTDVTVGDGGEPLVYCDGTFSRLEAIA